MKTLCTHLNISGNGTSTSKYIMNIIGFILPCYYGKCTLIYMYCSPTLPTSYMYVTPISLTYIITSRYEVNYIRFHYTFTDIDIF